MLTVRWKKHTGVRELSRRMNFKSIEVMAWRNFVKRERMVKMEVIRNAKKKKKEDIQKTKETVSSMSAELFYCQPGMNISKYVVGTGQECLYT